MHQQHLYSFGIDSGSPLRNRCSIIFPKMSLLVTVCIFMHKTLRAYGLEQNLLTLKQIVPSLEQKQAKGWKPGPKPFPQSLPGIQYGSLKKPLENLTGPEGYLWFEVVLQWHSRRLRMRLKKEQFKKQFISDDRGSICFVQYLIGNFKGW